MNQNQMSQQQSLSGTEAASIAARQRFASMGVGLLALALVAVVTGVALLPFYRASVEGAYHSVVAMQASLPLRLLRGVHHWASALLILLGAAYLAYGLISCSYRYPWRLAWVVAVALVLLFVAFQLTGHLLPWDRHGVSSTAIEAGIAENVPVVGPVQAKVMRGGTEAVSPQTLNAWYVAHVALFPLALLVLAGLLLSQFRRMSGRWVVPWGPVGAALGVLVVAAVALQVPLGPVARPADYSSYAAPPEWYILPLHGLLRLAQDRLGPNLAFLGTVVAPGLTVLFLLALPWIDPKAIHHPPSRLVQSVTALGVLAVTVLAAVNAGHMAPVVGSGSVPAEGGRPAKPTTTTASLDPALVAKGKTLFANNGCAGCHKVGGQGGAVGPPLDGVGTRQPDLDWQIRHLKDPGAVVKGSTMPPFKQLSDSDLKALATYLLSLK
jgi:ubiquinol-cytochrome c reductase cytochrome b subunit